jgi:hypothetical protein
MGQSNRVESNVARYWAPKVRMERIRLLYETDAKGVVDEDLIDDVGYALLARCDTIRIVTERRCPKCDEKMPFGGKTVETARDAPVSCTNCGWTTTWAHYHRSYKGKRIHGGRAYPAFLRFIAEFGRRQPPRQRLMAIDRLIHAIHEASLTAPSATPGSVNLIEGKREDIVRFLDDLAYGDTATGSTSAWRRQFRDKMQEGEVLSQKHLADLEQRRAKRRTETRDA